MAIGGLQIISNHVRRMIIKIAKYAYIMVIILMLSGCNLQYKLLYYPSTIMPSKDVLTANNIQYWPSNTGKYKGYVSTAKSNHVMGTIIVFHGNASTAADRTYYIEALVSLGYRVILAEYPGYGARGGKLGEKSFVNDAKETVHDAYKHYGSPLFLLGESLGCGVAAAVAKEPPVTIDGILLITPWDTLLSVAKSKFPWLPLRFFMKDKYDSMSNLKDYQGRIAVVGAERDETIPIRHAVALYQSLHGRKAMWVVKEAGHNDWPMIVDKPWWREIMEFLSAR
jgi:pimeloyl-ACP methyl ester carboxylesterase